MDLDQRLQRLAAAGGDLSSVRAGLDRILRAAVGYDIGAISTVDPSTMLWTSCLVSGAPPGAPADAEGILYQLEFEGGEVNSFADLSEGRLVGRLRHDTGGEPARARRWSMLLESLGCVDELRAVLRHRGFTWGTLILYRTEGRPPFTDADEARVRGAIPAMADLLRLTMLRAAIDMPGALDQPPGMLLVDAAGDLVGANDAARHWLDAVDDRARMPSAIRSVAASVTAGNALARAALPSPAGWVVLHASSFAGGEGPIGIIVEGARPVVVSEVIASAYGLTPREREIIGRAAQGRSTKQLAADLGISPFTVQDHLKAVFAKVGVQSRGELVATLYVQQYAPRREAGATPGPYGWYLDDRIAG